MKFEKIIIPPGWQDSFTKYPNGRTIFEALTATTTSVNEGIDSVNTKVDQGLLAIDAAADTIRSEVNTSFLILQNKLEQDFEYLQDDLVADISVLQSQVNAAVDSVADKVTQSQLDAVNAQLAEKALKTDVGLLSGLLTTAKTSIVNAINELFNGKANKVQEAWITPTLLNGATGTVQYMKDNFGFVRFKGRLLTCGAGTSAFALPAGYRILTTALFPAGGNITGVNKITVTDTYQVVPQVALSGAFYLDLSGISFRAEA